MVEDDRLVHSKRDLYPVRVTVSAGMTPDGGTAAGNEAFDLESSGKGHTSALLTLLQA